MLYSEAIRTLAEAVSIVLEAQNKKGVHDEMLSRLTDIVNDDLTVSERKQAQKKDRSSAKKNPDKFYYEGISVVDIDEAARPEINLITVSKGETLVFSFRLNRKLRGVVDEAGNLVGLFRLPKNKMQIRAKLKEFAKKELEEPGYFMNKVVDTF